MARHGERSALSSELWRGEAWVVGLGDKEDDGASGIWQEMRL